MGIVFDLDDTILPEAEYVRSGMRAVGAYCASRLSPVLLRRFLDEACTDGLPALPEGVSRGAGNECPPTASYRLLCAQTVSRFLLDEFERGVRNNSFDRLLAAFPALNTSPETSLTSNPYASALPPLSSGGAAAPGAERRKNFVAEPEDVLAAGEEGMSVAELVQAYRTHVPEIVLPKPWRWLLEALRARGIRMGIISDGPLAAQEAKVRALGLEEYCAPVLLTDRWGREFWKPAERAYREIERQWGEEAATLTYVGDNPAKDFLAANRLGWRTVRLRLPEQLHYRAEASDPAYAARIVCESFPELAQQLTAAAI